jgi:uncharacterized protein (DUF302 family)
MSANEGNKHHSQEKFSMHKDISVNHVFRSFPTTYDEFISRFESRLGRHNISAYENLLSDPNRTKDVEAVLQRQEGADGLMLFTFYDYGALLSIKGSPRKARQYIVGNPLYAARMTQHDIRAALYAPLRVLVYADDSGMTCIEYDLPSTLFGQFENDKLNEVAAVGPENV